MTPDPHVHADSIVVRDGPGVDRLVDAVAAAGGADEVGGGIRMVADVFEALAVVADQREPGAIRAVALPEDSLGDEPDLVREAFRRIDPSVRLVLLTADAAGRAESGFDRVIPIRPEDPAATQELADALEIPARNAEGRRWGQTAQGGMASQPESALLTDARSDGRFARSDADLGGRPMRTDRRPPIRSQAEVSETPRSVARDARLNVVDMVVGDALQAFATRATPAEASPLSPLAPGESAEQDTTVTDASTGISGEDAIGDTDLVDAVHAGENRLEDLALRLLRRELGTDEIHLRTLDDETPLRTGDAVVPVRTAGETLGVLTSPRCSSTDLEPWADWLARWLRLDRAHQQLARLAWTDELTGAGNRRAFEQKLEEILTIARRDRRAVTLMYFDIDEFKTYNDRFGHDAGDEVLREVVSLLRVVIRRGDHLFRVGGDEFVVLFADSRGARPEGTPGHGIESIETIAQRFRERMACLRLAQLGLDAPGTVSVSAGVATFPWDGHDPKSLLAHADRLSLQSKRGGKNMITFGPGARDHCCES